MSSDDEAAFRRYATELTVSYGLIGSTFMIVAIVAWWPIDWLVQPDAKYLEGFAFMRKGGLVLEIGTAALFLWSRRVQAGSLFFASILLAALLGWIGYGLGRIGGSELSWLADAILGTLPAALIPLPLRQRIAATTLVGLALPAGFFLPFPENLLAPAVRGQISFTVFAILGAIALGEILYRVVRRSFLQERSLARTRAALADLNASLAERVEEQTRELRALAGHLERVQEAEWRRISRELHDELAQELTAMRYALALFERRRERDPDAMFTLLADLDALLDGMTSTVRSFISDLRPRVLDDLGLAAGAEWLRDRVRAAGEVECSLHVSSGFADADEGLDPEIALVLFRVLQEATTNARRHGGARAIEMSLEADSEILIGEVKDDGSGFDPSAPSPGFGLLGIRERVRAAGGELVLESRSGYGTRVAALIPRRSPLIAQGKLG